MTDDNPVPRSAKSRSSRTHPKIVDRPAKLDNQVGSNRTEMVEVKSAGGKREQG